MQHHWGTEEGGCRLQGVQTTKLRVYNAIVKPTQLYGCETLWTLLNRHMKKLQAREMRYVRKVKGVTRMDKMTSEGS